MVQQRVEHGGVRRFVAAVEYKAAVRLEGARQHRQRGAGGDVEQGDGDRGRRACRRVGDLCADERGNPEKEEREQGAGKNGYRALLDEPLSSAAQYSLSSRAARAAYVVVFQSLVLRFRGAPRCSGIKSTGQSRQSCLPLHSF